jgi:hypothetical protein
MVQLPLLLFSVAVGLMAQLASAHAALIQLRGGPLNGGWVRGGAMVPLERAPGGQTPVLTFNTPRGEVRLLVDTGASSSMVTPELATRLSLPIQSLAPEAFSLAGGGEDCGALKAGSTRLPRLTLPSREDGDPLDAPHQSNALRIDGLEALVIAADALPAGLDGVLGSPTLRQIPFLVDPHSNRVVLGAGALSEGLTPSPLPRLTIPLRWRLGVPLLKLTTVKGTVAALADTGAEGLFVTPELAARLHPLGKPQPLRLVGVCGEQPVLRQTMAGMTLGSTPLPLHSVGEVAVIITASPIFAQLGVEAIVGQELLGPYVQSWRLDSQPPILEIW